MKLLQENTKILTVDIFAKGNGVTSEYIESLSFDITLDDKAQELYYTSDNAIKEYLIEWLKDSYFFHKYANTDVFKFEFSCKLFK